jgi:hypothetical protein
MQYRVITVCQVFSPRKALDKLTKEVNDAINQGWEPLGGVTLAGTTYLQALLKRR